MMKRYQDLIERLERADFGNSQLSAEVNDLLGMSPDYNCTTDLNAASRLVGASAIFYLLNSGPWGADGWRAHILPAKADGPHIAGRGRTEPLARCAACVKRALARKYPDAIDWLRSRGEWYDPIADRQLHPSVETIPSLEQPNPATASVGGGGGG